MDHLVTLPHGFQYCYQFENGRSNERCCESVLSMVAQIAFPGRYQDPKLLMHELYVELVGKGDPNSDNPNNLNGTTKEAALAWLVNEKIGHIDMSHLLADLDNFKHEVQAQNAQSVCQIMTVRDMSKLRYAKNNGLLYDWKGGGAGVSHVILRVGYSDSEGYGLYFDPAASPALPHPLPIMWENLLEAGIEWACAIMPFHVDVPKDPNFSFQHQLLVPPAPKPEDVLATVRSQVAAERQQTHILLEQLRTQVEQVEQKEDAAFLDTLRQLGLKV